MKEYKKEEIRNIHYNNKNEIQFEYGGQVHHYRIENLKEVFINCWNLQQENKQLKERIAYLERSNNRREDTILEQRQKISDLEDNWNKLKEYLHNVDAVVDYSENYDGYFINYDELIDKIQELEQGSDK